MPVRLKIPEKPREETADCPKCGNTIKFFGRTQGGICFVTSGGSAVWPYVRCDKCDTVLIAEVS